MGRVPWDVVEGPIVHTERLFLDFPLDFLVLMAV